MASAEAEDKAIFTLLWRIENFSYWDRKCHGEKIIGPTMVDIFFLGDEASLHLFPKGKEEGDKHLRVQLHFKLSLEGIFMIAELSFLDGSGSALTTGSIRNYGTDMSLDFPHCPTQEEVFQSKRSSFLPHDTLTVRCRLWKSDVRPSICRHISARSRIEVREASILLRHGFLKTLQLGEQEKYELYFDEGSRYNQYSWARFDHFSCTYSLTGSSLSNAVLDLKIDRFEGSKTRLITCKVSLLSTEGKTIKCKEESHKFNPSTETQSWHFPHFLTREELDNRDIDGISTQIIASAYNISLTSTEKMVGEASMEFVYPKYDVSTLSDASIQATHQIRDQPETSPQRSNSATILVEDLLSIYKDQTLSDFELRSDNVSFRVHKNVLSARSPVFKAMFCGDMREVESTSLDIPDVDAHTLNRMLTFLYAGSVDDLQWQGAVKLYYAADKYQVLSLKLECSSLLRSSIGVSNVCHILALADRHQDHELTSFVHDFILKHYEEILLSDEWGTFLETDAYLAGITMRTVYRRKLEVPK